MADYYRKHPAIQYTGSNAAAVAAIFHNGYVLATNGTTATIAITDNTEFDLTPGDWAVGVRYGDPGAARVGFLRRCSDSEFLAEFAAA